MKYGVCRGAKPFAGCLRMSLRYKSIPLPGRGSGGWSKELYSTLLGWPGLPHPGVVGPVAAQSGDQTARKPSAIGPGMEDSCTSTTYT